ncbi:hypothetical protein VOLCADRAFT_86151 [Volvox carteri f. nagariensis]|uniref:DUF952 domain-containing protein n=1 Tax=Volvox carteri f. nagariensis TaxID=3068 RepID=D8TI04_VOLCA|nr:uncharacterized protein VOLCADRAFT_86151 [Volvox carteri f. nagariensis]EFJ53156.1 hypothetical protein VOLCADRAFT_86151 [Volvox carteri f. nagariensis]|eukprot:XP_002946161.1 hypothetical protein VOLCADRAFT_86151 [Volvox carteri f. nagariensis]
MPSGHAASRTFRSGPPACTALLVQDGFIHLTADPAFLLGIGNHFYRDVPGDFLLLVLDPAKLTAKVVFEPAAAVGHKSSEGLPAPPQTHQAAATPYSSSSPPSERTTTAVPPPSSSSSPPASSTSSLAAVAAAEAGQREPSATATSSAGILFPHLYGTINYDAVQSELAIQRDTEGRFVDIPALLPLGHGGHQPIINE